MRQGQDQREVAKAVVPGLPDMTCSTRNTHSARSRHTGRSRSTPQEGIRKQRKEHVFLTSANRHVARHVTEILISYEVASHSGSQESSCSGKPISNGVPRENWVAAGPNSPSRPTIDRNARDEDAAYKQEEVVADKRVLVRSGVLTNSPANADSRTEL